MDQHLTMSEHVQTTVRNAFYKIREISYYRKFLTTSATKTLIHAYVTSRLDYCNGLLYDLPKDITKKLQYVHNTAAKLVTLGRKYDSATPILKELHWLPIEFRIKFKILIQVFKSLNNLAPKYLSDKLVILNGPRVASDKILEIPKVNGKTYGDRAFSVAGPRLWNKLPRELRTHTKLDAFKRDLKTHLFKQAFRS